MKEPIYFNRDLSWLRFNERVLLEAANTNVPLVERIRFLSIFSSNLDEFFRVRMPVLSAMSDVSDERNAREILPDNTVSAYENARVMIGTQQEMFGHILVDQLIPALYQRNICLVYNAPIPSSIAKKAEAWFLNTVSAYLEIVPLEAESGFFPSNNGLYIAVELDRNYTDKPFVIINIPSGDLPRFYTINDGNLRHVLFLDDIIKHNLSFLFPADTIKGAYSIKITRDADLDLQDELEGDIAQKIEYQITQRDLGSATRLLYQPGIPNNLLQSIVSIFKLFNASKIEGGHYHNLKDLFSFPVTDSDLLYPKQTPVSISFAHDQQSLFAEMQQRDLFVHPPYHAYETVLRFFNQAAIDPAVEEIYTTMYRVASDSQIVHALISAVKNGKKVTVFVELKARFDEANNIKWAKRMKNAGVKIIYSIPNLKVHSKIALVKRKKQYRLEYFGLLATGNLNETTARFYTDHILLTTNPALTSELEMVFIFLSKRKKPGSMDAIQFEHLLVSQFNLQSGFLRLIDNEIAQAKKGKPARITIKLNNLEERVLINKLYEAGNAGVKIDLIVRSICCLVPGVPGLSENITVRRIVDRYLEHGRVFIFHNNGDEKYFLGSADWMNRNIYRRIEVCFPLYDKALQAQVKNIITLQLNDTVSAVVINRELQNIPFEVNSGGIASQPAIYAYVKEIERA